MEHLILNCSVLHFTKISLGNFYQLLQLSTSVLRCDTKTLFYTFYFSSRCEKGTSKKVNMFKFPYFSMLIFRYLWKFKKDNGKLPRNIDKRRLRTFLHVTQNRIFVILSKHNWEHILCFSHIFLLKYFNWIGKGLKLIRLKFS